MKPTFACAEPATRELRPAPQNLRFAEGVPDTATPVATLTFRIASGDWSHNEIDAPILSPNIALP